MLLSINESKIAELLKSSEPGYTVFTSGVPVAIENCQPMYPTTSVASGTAYFFPVHGTGAGAGTAVAVDPLQGVREIVGAILGARPLPTEQSLSELLVQAAVSRGTPANIETWARDIADGASKLND